LRKNRQYAVIVRNIAAAWRWLLLTAATVTQTEHFIRDSHRPQYDNWPQTHQNDKLPALIFLCSI